MGKKARTTLTIDAEVLRKAHEIGLNVSQFCENALKQAIKALEQTKIQTEVNGGLVDARSASPPPRVDGTGFEPATSAMPTPRSFQADLPAQTVT
jgi:post-segregation antitoxin (ccd killing protein)